MAISQEVAKSVFHLIPLEDGRWVTAQRNKDNYWKQRVQDAINHNYMHVTSPDTTNLPLEGSCEDCNGNDRLMGTRAGAWWNWLTNHVDAGGYSDLTLDLFDLYMKEIQVYRNSLTSQAMTKAQKAARNIIDAVRIDSDKADFSVNLTVYLIVNLIIVTNDFTKEIDNME